MAKNIFLSSDFIAEILADTSLLALEAIQRGRDVGYTKQADLLILNCLRTLDEEFTRTDEEHDFLKKFY